MVRKLAFTQVGEAVDQAAAEVAKGPSLDLPLPEGSAEPMARSKRKLPKFPEEVMERVIGAPEEKITPRAQKAWKGPKEEVVQMSLRLPESAYNLFRQLCFVNRVSHGQMIEIMLDAHMRQQEK